MMYIRSAWTSWAISQTLELAFMHLKKAGAVVEATVAVSVQVRSVTRAVSIVGRLH